MIDWNRNVVTLLYMRYLYHITSTETNPRKAKKDFLVIGYRDDEHFFLLDKRYRNPNMQEIDDEAILLVTRHSIWKWYRRLYL